MCVGREPTTSQRASGASAPPCSAAVEPVTSGAGAVVGLMTWLFGFCYVKGVVGMDKWIQDRWGCYLGFSDSRWKGIPRAWMQIRPAAFSFYHHYYSPILKKGCSQRLVSCTPVRGRRMGSQMAPLVTSSSTLKLIPPAGDITFLSEEIVTDGDIGRHETCDVLWIACCSCDPKCVGFLNKGRGGRHYVADFVSPS